MTGALQHPRTIGQAPPLRFENQTRCARFLQVARIEGLPQRFHEEAAEKAGQDSNGQEEARLAVDPSLAIG